MPKLPYNHIHMSNSFRVLKKPFVTDDGEFTHLCVGCDSPTGFQYEDYCEAGCEVSVTECDSCQGMRERTGWL